jgi:hypothetical protein
MDGLAADSTLPFEDKYRRSFSVMYNRADELHRRLPKWFVTGENTELHVKVGNRPVEKLRTCVSG